MPQKTPGDLMLPQQGSGLRDIVLRIKLILRLMTDRRVNFFLKLIPIAALAYFISPVDLAPGVALPVIGALDDAAVLWLGSYLFVEFCPPSVVQEHLRALTQPAEESEIIDAEVCEANEQQK
ncbi:MAG: YkvA family protein [Anaerolineae bacterium]